MATSNSITIPMGNAPLTMTSREIADLTGKRHADVLRDIDRLIESLNAELRLGFESSTYVDSTGKENRQFILDRDSVFCLVAGYDATARMRIIKRWQELEAEVANPPIKLVSPAELMLQQAQCIVANERRTQEIEDKVTRIDQETKEQFAKTDEQLAKTDERLAALESTPVMIQDALTPLIEQPKPGFPHTAFYTVSQYLQFHHPEKHAALKAKSKRPFQGLGHTVYSIVKKHLPTYVVKRSGNNNVYPLWLLDQVFKKIIFKRWEE